MRALSRPLAAAVLAGAAFLPAPAHAAQSDIVTFVCGPRTTTVQCDPFYVFRPCGPLVWCP